MSLRGLLLATQFLTRLPVPAPKEFSQTDVSRSAWWFPLVGAGVGILVLGVLVAARLQNPLLAAALGVLTWTWITGAMHLDGLADLADALGAAHRDPQRFFVVLADPHAGTFGIVSIVLALLLKFVLLAEMPREALVGVALIPAWARYGAMCWSRWLKPLKPGHAQQLASELPTAAIVIWGVVLMATGALVEPVLVLSPIAIVAWGVWLRVRLGGVTGDCLGAGIEVVEIVLLAALGSGLHLHH